jgi:hypothetical protein
VIFVLCTIVCVCFVSICGLFLFVVRSYFFVEMVRRPSANSRLEAALEQEMAAQRYLNINMQASLNT